jgi:hypothetical protein
MLLLDPCSQVTESDSTPSGSFSSKGNRVITNEEETSTEIKAQS